QGDEGNGVPARGDLVFREIDHREDRPPELHAIAQIESRAPVGDDLEVALPDRTPGDYLSRSARPTRLEADDVQPHLPSQPLRFDRLIGDRAGRHDTGQPGNGLAAVARDARGFRKRAPRSRLHHPQVDAVVAGDRQSIDDDAAVDADHGQDHAEQQAQTEAGQQESEQVVAHVAESEVHGRASYVTRAARPSCSDGVVRETTSAWGGRPSRISSRESSVRYPNETTLRLSRPASTLHTVPRLPS